MNLKQSFSVIALCFFWMVPLVASAVPVRFARTPALSPDGTRVAFGWRGDIWLASVRGGGLRPDVQPSKLINDENGEHPPF